MIYTIEVPRGWLGFTNLRHLAPTSIPPGDWSEDVYAGRLTIWGHRVRLTDIPAR